MHDDSRTATFSSSQAYHLMTRAKNQIDFGNPALKYIKQVKQEMKLGRSIKNEFQAKETSWGTFLELRAFKLLDSSYQNVANQQRLLHPDIRHYSGVPDFLKDFNTVADCKCCFNMEKFCDKMEALEDYGTFKEEFPNDFWQLISNLVLLRANGLDIDHIEAINYVPYEHELSDIRMSADGNPSMRWLDYTTDNGLPWVPDNGHYKNINVHRFRVMERDVEEWTQTIKLAVATLLGTDKPSVIHASPARKEYVDPGPKKIAKLNELL